MFASESRNLLSLFSTKPKSWMPATAVLAADTTRSVQESGPIARALNFASDAQGVDCAVRSGRRYCDNCAMFSRDAGNSGRCDVFAGKRVPTTGWCAAWSTAEAQ